MPPRPPRPRAARRALPALLVALAAATAAACGGADQVGGPDTPPPGSNPGPSTPPPAATPVARVALDPGTATLAVGAQATFTARALDSAGNVLAGREVAWSSSAPEIATVAGGVVTALRQGSAIVTARVGTVAGQAFFTVGGAAAASIAVSPDGATMAPGATQQLAATVRDSSGGAIGGARVVWSSSDATIASVSTAGVVTAHRAGIVLVRARSGAAAGATVLDVREGGAADPATLDGTLAMGSDWGCGLDAAGQAFCWGNWEASGRGDSVECQPCEGPRPVRTEARFRRILPAGRVVIAHATDGTVHQWGSDNGAGMFEQRITSLPTPVPGGRRFTDVRAHEYAAFGWTEDGRLWAWGANYYGRLGDGTWEPRTTPVPIGGDTLRFRDVAGVGSTEGTYFLATDGRLYLAGSGWTPRGTAMVRINTALRFVEIHTGTYGVLAQTADGALYEVQADGSATRVGGSHRYRVVILDGADGTTGLTTDGRLFAWGTKRTGQYSVVQDVPLHEATPGRTWTTVAAHFGNTIAMDANGDVHTWGWYGAPAGAGTTNGSATPRPPHDPTFVLEMPSTTTTVAAGGTVSLPVRVVEVPGGFTRRGPRPFTGRVALSATVGQLGTAEVSPRTLFGAGDEGTVTARLSATASPGRAHVLVEGTAAGSATRSTGSPIDILPPPPPPGASGPYDLRCTSGTSTSLPAGFHCVDNGQGNVAPARYTGDAAFNGIHGTWVDTGAGVCVTWGPGRTATARWSPAGLGGSGQPTTTSGAWGVLAKQDGTLVGTATKWYVFTAALDDQTRLLGYDSAAPAGAQVMGYNFTKRACPW